MAIRIPFRIKSENLYKFIQIHTISLAFRVFVGNEHLLGAELFASARAAKTDEP